MIRSGYKQWCVIVCLVLVVGTGCVSGPPDHTQLERAIRDSAKSLGLDKDPNIRTSEGDMPGTEQALSLADSFKLALHGNREFVRRQRAVVQAFYSRRIAETELLLPTLTADYTIDGVNDSGSGRIELHYDGPGGVAIEPFVELERNNANTDSHTTSHGVVLSRPLLTVHEGMRVRLPVTQASRDILKAANSLQLDKRALRLRVTRRYLEVQRAKARLAIRARRVEDTREFREMTATRVDTGFAAPVDLVNARINHNQAEADLLSAETNLENTRDALKEILGLELSMSLRTAAFVPFQDDRRFPLDEHSALVAKRHEDIVNQRLDMAVADQEIAIQRDTLRPQIDVTLTAEKEGSGADFFASNDPEADDLTLGLSYSTTLDFKRADRARLQRLESQQSDRHSVLEDRRIALQRELRSAHRNIGEQRRRIELAQSRFAAEQEKLKATLARYERGNVDNLEVTRAKQAVDNAEISLLDAQINLWQTVTQYESILPSPAQ